MGMVTRLLLAYFTVFLFPYFCFDDFTGPVVSVLDGDTIEVLHNTHPERVRLSGIDYPEKWINTTISSSPALRFSHSPPRMGRSEWPPCPSRFRPSVAFPCTAPSWRTSAMIDKFNRLSAAWPGISRLSLLGLPE